MTATASRDSYLAFDATEMDAYDEPAEQSPNEPVQRKTKQDNSCRRHLPANSPSNIQALVIAARFSCRATKVHEGQSHHGTGMQRLSTPNPPSTLLHGHASKPGYSQWRMKTAATAKIALSGDVDTLKPGRKCCHDTARKTHCNRKWVVRMNKDLPDLRKTQRIERWY
jgi:hypothetical protein